MKSAPALRLASMPAMNAAARPLRRRKRTTWWTPCARATVDRVVARAVVDDQRLDDVDARHRSRQIGERGRQRLGLVQARDLDDELHRVAIADQPLDDACPRDRCGRARTPRRPRRGALRDRRRGGRCASPSGFGSGVGDAAVHAVDHELVRAARVGRRDDRLVREKRLERDVAVVLVERRKDDRRARRRTGR